MGFIMTGGCVGILDGGASPASDERQSLKGGMPDMSRASAITIAGGAGFSVRCFWSPAGRLLRKEERGPLGRNVWAYSFDERNHLVEARKDGVTVERYAYDETGRRVADHLAWQGEERQFIYYYDGSLIRLDDEYLSWTERGQLKATYNRSRRCEYTYGSDTRLDSVFLPSGKVISYEYGKELMPVRVFEGNEPVAEYEWANALRLTRYIDIRNGLVYTFAYGDARAPQAVTVTGRPDAVRAAAGLYATRLVLHIGVDQVDSLRVLATPAGLPVKCIEYDSFGNVTRDTRPELYLPLGFACGLNDPYTGFVRFGFRDYHPLIGRFTAKDPIGYTGGDNDLWDYCVDDPVSCADPLGLWTQENFDESRITRNEEGQFTSNGSTSEAVVDPADIRRLSEYLPKQDSLPPQYGRMDAALGIGRFIQGQATRALSSPVSAVASGLEPLKENITNAAGLADSLEFFIKGQSEGKTGAKTKEALETIPKRLREEWPGARDKLLQGVPKIGDGLSRLPDATMEKFKKYREKNK